MNVHPGRLAGSVASAEEKHSTSESPASDDPKKAPRASQRTPSRPKQPSSTLVDIGFRSRHRPNPSLRKMVSAQSNITIAEDVQCEHDQQAGTAHKDGEWNETSCETRLASCTD